MFMFLQNVKFNKTFSISFSQPTLHTFLNHNPIIIKFRELLPCSPLFNSSESLITKILFFK